LLGHTYVTQAHGGNTLLAAFADNVGKQRHTTARYQQSVKRKTAAKESPPSNSVNDVRLAGSLDRV